MRENKNQILILMAVLISINYVVMFIAEGDILSSIYKLALILISIFYAPKQKPSFKPVIFVLISAMSVFVPYVNSGEVFQYFSNVTYYTCLSYGILLLNSNPQKMLLADLFELCTYPIMWFEDMWYGTINFVKNFKVNENANAKQIMFGFLAALPAMYIITIMLGNSDQQFLNIMDYEVILRLIASIIPALIYVSLLTYYQGFKRKESASLNRKIGEWRTEYLQYNSFANVFLISIIPVQVAFIIYEVKKMFETSLLYGESVSSNYYLIICVVQLNALFIIGFYYFYNGDNKVAKTIRNILLSANYLLLFITTMQVVIYVINVTAITEKRYFALISILIMFVINIILQIKTNKKAKNIIKYIYLVIIFVFTLFMMIDADSIVYHYNINQEQVDTDYLKELNPVWK